jgi:hypothetical protein
LADKVQLFEGPPTRTFDCAYVEAGLQIAFPQDTEMCAYAQDNLQGPSSCYGIGDNLFGGETTESPAKLWNPAIWAKMTTFGDADLVAKNVSNIG